MKLVVFGAAGRTGREVVGQAVAAGHDVIAVSRHVHSDARPGVEWRVADVLRPEQVAGALAGAQAVVVCLGPTGPGDTSCGAGTANVVRAMREAGIRRLACQTGAMIGHPRRRLGWMLRAMRRLFRASSPAAAADRDAQEAAVRGSDLDFALIRPARLSDGPPTPSLVASEVPVPSLATSRRADVAAALLAAVEPPGGSGRSQRELVVLSRPPMGTGFVARWALAYGLGELVGLGGVGVMFSAAHAPASPFARIGAAVAAGIFEGAVVGAALAAVLTAFRPELRFGAWVRATIAGALVGWGLGTLPAIVLAGDAVGAAHEPALPLRLAGAAALGAVAGPILAAFQAPVLRRNGVKVRTWIGANALAWALAMPLVFVAASDAWTSAGAIARGALALTAAGALVGAITGRAIARAAR